MDASTRCARSTAPAWLAVVVTNQAGVARGLLPGVGVPTRCRRCLRRDVEAGGARLDAVYACLHHPSVGEPPYRAGLRLPQAAPGPAAARRERARRGPAALVGDRRSHSRPAARLERRRAGRAREERLRPRRAHLPRAPAGRASPTSWPRTCWRRSSASSAGGGRANRARRGSRRWCAASAGRRVLVLADLVADEFVYGRVERVSREAPVLILRHDATDVRLGGGANAVHNIRTLGGAPLPVRRRSARTRHGRRLRALLRAKGISTRGVVDRARLRDAGEDAHPGRRRALHEAADRADRPLRAAAGEERRPPRARARAALVPRQGRRRAGERLRLRPARRGAGARGGGVRAPRAGSRSRSTRASRCCASAA